MDQNKKETIYGNVMTRISVHLYIIGYWEDMSREVQFFFFFCLLVWGNGTEKYKLKREKNEKREIESNAI